MLVAPQARRAEELPHVESLACQAFLLLNFTFTRLVNLRAHRAPVFTAVLTINFTK